jgi:threonine dehydratase
MINILDIYKAKRNISPYVHRTPLVYSKFLSDLTGGEVWLKYENRQLTGSFKIRGAANRMLAMRTEERRRGVITASAGNHGQGVAYMAKELKIRARVYVPKNSPEVKCAAMRDLGVELIIHGSEYMDAERLAIKTATQENAIYISGYNDPLLIAGQGTVGLEMLEDKPDLDTILVPLGAGGLAGGVAVSWKSASRAEVIGIQSQASPVMHVSLKAGRILDIPLKDSIAEGLHGGIDHGSITFELCKLLDEVILVEEKTIREAMRFMILKHREIVEGAGAVGIAALMEQPKRFKGKKIGVIISGGNLDEREIKELVSS